MQILLINPISQNMQISWWDTCHHAVDSKKIHHRKHTFLYPTLNLCSEQQNTNCYWSERNFYCSILCLCVPCFLFKRNKRMQIKLQKNNNIYLHPIFECTHHFWSLTSIFLIPYFITDHWPYKFKCIIPSSNYNKRGTKT